MEEHKADIKDEPIDYDLNDVDSASERAQMNWHQLHAVKEEQFLESEWVNVIKELKSEAEHETNIKDEPLACASDDIDPITASILDSEFNASLVSRNIYNTEVEENGEEDKTVVKNEYLDYELERPAIENCNASVAKQFECHKCNYKGKRKTDLSKHFLFVHEREKAPRYSCELCPYETIRKQDLSRHIVCVHEKEKAPRYACELCPLELSDKRNLRKHMRLHNGYSIECTFCHKSFKRKEALDGHYVSAHWDQSDSFKHLTHKVNQCPKCSYITLHSSHFKYHLLTHEEDRNKFSFECHTCGYKCARKENLKSHIQLHADYTPFECTECNKGFNRKQHLDKHIVSQHKENEQLMETVTSKIYQCSKCTYKTTESNNLKRHIPHCKS